MPAITSLVMKAVVFSLVAASLSGCAPVLALAPLAAGVSLIALDNGNKAPPHVAATTVNKVQYPEAETPTLAKSDLQDGQKIARSK
jgi:hypothetical protein